MIPPPQNADARLVATRWRFLETALITLALPGAGLIFRPPDPLFVRADFPWLVLPPLLVGLRYGFAHGFSSAIAIFLAILASWRFAVPSALPEFPVSTAVGVLLVGMLSGEFCDVWIRRIQKLELVNDYRRQRLDEFTRTYHLLKISHDLLEHRLVGSAQSLRDALLQLRRILIAEGEPKKPVGLDRLGGPVMAIFGNFGWVHGAALHAIDDQGRVEATTIASLGKCPPLDGKDPMLRRVLERRSLVSVRGDEGEPERVLESPWLAVIPIQDVYQRIWAVLAVHEMPFIAFHDEHLRLLALLAGHIGDLFAQSRAIDASAGIEGHDFRVRLDRTVLDARDHQIPAMVVGTVFSGRAESARIVETLVAQRRGLDQEWVLKNLRSETVMLLVMPLTDRTGYDGYVARLERLVSETLKTSLPDAGIALHPIAVDGKTSSAALIAELEKKTGIAA